MSTALNPAYATVHTVRAAIQHALKADLPSDMLANAIAPHLTTVNQWVTQIPAVLEGPAALSGVNLVFAIRKDLFVAPQFTQSVMGITLVDLPTPFQEFISFTHKLIDAQKVVPEKLPAPRVSSVALLQSHVLKTSLSLVSSRREDH